MMPFYLPPAVRAFFEAFHISLWAESAAIVGGLFCTTLGWGVISRRGWAQTVLVPAHLLFVVYAMVGGIVAQLLRERPEMWWEGGPIFFIVLILANGGLALFLSSVEATEVLSWLPLQTSPVIPQRCEFCGTPLDPQTKQCPRCEAVPEIVQKHVTTALPHAKLTSLSDDTEFWIEPDRRTLVGRSLTGNDVNLDNPTVSRRHAQIEYDGEYFVLTALRDSNGTFINDTLVRQRVLRDGDEVRLGRARFQFSIIDDLKDQDDNG
jgi:hypothetical protein